MVLMMSKDSSRTLNHASTSLMIKIMILSLSNIVYFNIGIDLQIKV